MTDKIHMVDLKGQYMAIKAEVDQRIEKVLLDTSYINGPEVKEFEQNLSSYLNVKHVIACANGTDALQIALMSLNLSLGDEIIVPAFTYAATAEVISLLGLTPVLVDVELSTFNTSIDLVRQAITPQTKVIMPVHLFGQATEMNEILKIAAERNIFIIEDNAQAIGANFTLTNGEKIKTGAIGNIGCTSFYPSKNLGCYGDGGAVFTNDDNLASSIRAIANHGQSKRYFHSVVGCNSRLDSIQAAVLNVKLKRLDHYIDKRRTVASLYDEAFQHIDEIITPSKTENSDHVYHQYTLRVANGQRDQLKEYLTDKNIPSSIFYPLPLYKQEAYSKYVAQNFSLTNTEQLCREVLSLPIHTEMNLEIQNYIIDAIKEFFGSRR